VIYLTAEQVEHSSIPYRSASKIQFQNKQFTRGESFSIRLRQAAIEVCNAYANTGIECLLMEVDGHLTIWHQIVESQVQTSEPVSQSSAELKQTKPLRYRGAAINQALQPLPQPAVGQLQYRGAVIDSPTSSAQQPSTQPVESSDKPEAQPKSYKRFYRGVAI
jgi:hypothetical protein